MTAANNLAYLELRMSGGASNSDPGSSLGGVMSSTRLKSKTVTGIANVTGVTVDDAPGSADGNGTLTYNNTAKTLTWAPNGGSVGAAVTLAEDGRYTIPGSAGALLITVDYSELAASNQADTLAVSQIANALFDDISKTESFGGDVEYRCFYAYNAHPSDPFVGCKIYIGTNTTGADSLSLGLDAAGVATTIGNEGTVPTNINFSTPTALGSAISIGALTHGQAQAVWIRRTVPEQTDVSTPNDLSTLILNVGY